MKSFAYMADDSDPKAALRFRVPDEFVDLIGERVKDAGGLNAREMTSEYHALRRAREGEHIQYETFVKLLVAARLPVPDEEALRDWLAVGVALIACATPSEIKGLRDDAHQIALGGISRLRRNITVHERPLMK